MATQKAYASYQEITDLHTESDKVSVIGIHTPQGDTPRKMFGGFFDQFKKFKYLGASVTLVPAARLPVDPLGVSYEAGEPTIDPRDVLNPILFHGCHGNDMGSILNKLYGNPDYEDVNDSLDILESQEATQIDGVVGTLQRLYYMALTDNTWRKAHPQKGFKKSGLRPLVYSLASTRQIAPSQFFDPTWGHTVVAGDPDGGEFNEDDEWESKVTNLTPQLITPRLTSLGWLDTRNVMGFPVTITDPISTSEIGDASFETQKALALQQDVTLPKIFMGVILLPPAYKTEQYFRMIINHHFAFKGFRGISLRNDQVGNGALPGNVVDANGGFSDNANADGWIEGDTPFEPEPGPTPDPPEPDPPEPVDTAIHLKTADYVNNIAIGNYVTGGPYLNVYSKFTYQDVEYSLTGGMNFLFCRGVSCGDKTKIGLRPSTGYNSYAYYGGQCYTYNSDGEWEVATHTMPTPTLSPANAELLAAINSNTVFDMVFDS